MLHVVDHDVPTRGDPLHAILLQRISAQHGMYLQLTGAIRSADTAVRYLDCGVSRIILGTAAYQDAALAPAVAARCPNRWGVELHGRAGKAVIKGWTVAANKTPADYAAHFRGLGARCVVASEANTRDAIDAESLQRLRTLCIGAQLPVIHGADPETNDLLAAVFRLEKFGVMGTLIEQSIYSRRWTLADLVERSRSQEAAASSDETTILSDDDGVTDD